MAQSDTKVTRYCSSGNYRNKQTERYFVGAYPVGANTTHTSLDLLIQPCAARSSESFRGRTFAEIYPPV